jgi:hypothetical protein
VVVRGRDEVGADQAVGGGAADREAAGEQPERAGPGRRAQRAHGPRGSAARRLRQDLLRRDGPVGGHAEVRRLVAQPPHHEGYHGERGRRDDQRGGTPPARLDDGGQQRQEDQLAGRAAGGQYAGDQSTPLDEPPPGDRRHERERHRARAQADQHAPAEDELPAGLHEHGEPAARRHQHERPAHHPPHAELLHQRGGERRGEAEQDQVDRDRGGDGGQRPPELLVQRVQHHGGCGAEAGGADQRDERDGGHEPGRVEADLGRIELRVGWAATGHDPSFDQGVPNDEWPASHHAQ